MMGNIESVFQNKSCLVASLSSWLVQSGTRVGPEFFPNTGWARVGQFNLVRIVQISQTANVADLFYYKYTRIY